MRSFVHFIPLATSVFAAWFGYTLLRRWAERKSGPHLLWWGMGALFYAVLRRRTANRLTVALLSAVAVAATFVLLTPVDLSLVEPYRLSGRVMEWTWVRAFSPFINLYAAAFLIGGAILSAVRYRRRSETRHRYIGNVFIAVGALLPGIGGSFTRFGFVEVLYVTEFVGIILIYVGYRFNIWKPVRPAAQERERAA
jgi:hypothetical protein